jgi:uncharacterized membrane protein
MRQQVNEEEIWECGELEEIEKYDPAIHLLQPTGSFASQLQHRCTTTFFFLFLQRLSHFFHIVFSLTHCRIFTLPHYLCYMKKISSFHAGIKLIISLVAGVACFLLLIPVPMEVITRLMLSWEALSLSLITLSWITFHTFDPHDIRRLAKVQDESRIAVFILVLIAILSSLLAIVILLTTKGHGGLMHKEIRAAIYISGVICSWFLLHTMFTLRYAHQFYANDADTPAEQAGGLGFPEEENPDYFDFAYFSFVIGMTFQVSDVTITSRNIRRVVLLHGLLSFMFNTVIVALSINALLDLKG